MTQCSGSGRMDTFASSAVTERSMATGQPSRARTYCDVCGRAFIGRVVRSSDGIKFDNPHVVVPRHKR